MLPAQGKGGAKGGSRAGRRCTEGIWDALPHGTTAEVWVRKEEARAGHRVPERSHSLLHDHVAQGVAQGVILIVQHERDTVPVAPIRLHLAPGGEKTSCDLLSSGTAQGRGSAPCSAPQSDWQGCGSRWAPLVLLWDQNTFRGEGKPRNLNPSFKAA